MFMYTKPTASTPVAPVLVVRTGNVWFELQLCTSGYLGTYVLSYV